MNVKLTQERRGRREVVDDAFKDYVCQVNAARFRSTDFRYDSLHKGLAEIFRMSDGNVQWGFPRSVQEGLHTVSDGRLKRIASDHELGPQGRSVKSNRSPVMAHVRGIQQPTASIQVVRRSISTELPEAAMYSTIIWANISGGRRAMGMRVFMRTLRLAMARKCSEISAVSAARKFPEIVTSGSLGDERFELLVTKNVIPKWIR